MAKKTETITLETPIKREGGDIKALELRKPNAGELRGQNLMDLIQMDVNTLAKVLPRISTPSITEQEVNKMDTADLAACGIKVAGFLTPKSQEGESPQA